MNVFSNYSVQIAVLSCLASTMTKLLHKFEFSHEKGLNLLNGVVHTKLKWVENVEMLGLIFFYVCIDANI